MTTWDVKTFIYEPDEKGFIVRKYVGIEGATNLSWQDAKIQARKIKGGQIVRHIEK